MTEPVLSDAKKIVVAISTTGDGTYKAVANLIGDIKLPEETFETAKIKPHDCPDPLVIVKDKEIGDTELTFVYTKENLAAIKVHHGKTCFVKFTLPDNEAIIFKGVMTGIAPTDSTEEDQIVSKITFAFSGQYVPAGA